MTHHLIVAAHGSRRPEANREIRSLVENLREPLCPPFVEVAPAFLEFADPSVPSALDAAVAGESLAWGAAPWLNSSRR